MKESMGWSVIIILLGAGLFLEHREYVLLRQAYNEVALQVVLDRMPVGTKDEEIKAIRDVVEKSTPHLMTGKDTIDIGIIKDPKDGVWKVVR